MAGPDCGELQVNPLFETAGRQNKVAKKSAKMGRLFQTKNYELVTDIQTWKHSTPPQRMVEKITQEYAIELIVREIKKKGFEIETQKRNVDNNVELVATRWV